MAITRRRNYTPDPFHPPLDPLVVPDCPPGWYGNIDNVTCIKFYHEKKSWKDARVVCQADGGDLVKIKNSLKNDFILSLSNNGAWAQYWIGLRYEYLFRWVDDMDEVIFFKWQAGEPSDSNYEDFPCVQMTCGNDTMGTWGAMKCETEQKFICEKSPIAFVQFPDSKSPCLSGWTKSTHSDTCVKIYTDKKSWEEARAACQVDGADLVKIVDHSMNEFIWGLIVSSSLRISHWIGLHDLTEESVFRWLDETEQASFLHWAPGQPNNKWDGGQDCVDLGNVGVEEGKWNDNDCTYHERFICEKSLRLSIKAPRSVPKCLAGWSKSVYSGTCIKQFDQEKGWHDARATCQAHGGDLLKIIDHNSNNFYKRVTQGDYWIGLNDLQTEGSFCWLDEKKEAQHLALKTTPSHGAQEDCVYMTIRVSGKGLWKTEQCRTEKLFICERSSHSVVHTTATQLGREFLCPRGWIRSSGTGTCIKLFNDRKSWDDARDSCKAREGDLVKVVDFSMNQMIMDQIPTKLKAHTHQYSDRYWIGLRADKNVFRWLEEEGTQGHSEFAYLGYNGRKKRKASRDKRYYWPNNIVPYEIQQGVSDQVRQWISEAITHWEKHTCLRFPQRQRELNYVVFVSGADCMSYIGMGGWLPHHPGHQDIVTGCENVAGIIHEIGHAIGFHHEHSRPDRDLYIDIPASQAEEQDLAKFGPDIIDTFDLDYDYLSQMHYGPHHVQNLTTRDKNYQDKIGMGQWLSFLDIKLANLMYKCDERCQPRPWCPEEGFIGQDCQCYCEGPAGEMDPVQLCDISRWLQPQFCPWSQHFNKTMPNTCAEIDTSEVLSGFWSIHNCHKENNYICERPQIPTGRIAELYLPFKDEDNSSTMILNQPSNLTTYSEVISGKQEGPLDINCNGDIVGVLPIVKNITRLQIMEIVVLPGRYRVSPVADFMMNGGTMKTVKQIPAGRNWTVDFTRNNTESTHPNLQLTIHDAKCSDEGYYQCIVTFQDERVKGVYNNTDSVRVSHHQWVAIKAPIKNVNVSVELYESTSVHIATDRVVLTCSVDGPEDVEFFWRKWSAGKDYFYTSYMYKNSKRPSRIPDDGFCGIWRRRSTLTFKATVYKRKIYVDHIEFSGQEGMALNRTNVPHKRLLAVTPVYVTKSRNQLVSDLFWCSTKSYSQILHSKGVNLTLSEEAYETPGPSGFLTEIKVGDYTGQVIINCNVNNVKREATDVRGLEITRRPLHKMYYNREKIVSFYPKDPLGDKNYFYKPEDRNWTLDLVGFSPDSTVARNLKIQWVIYDPRCDDNGKYRCTVVYGARRTRKATHSKVLSMASNMPGDPTRCLTKTSRWFGDFDEHRCRCREGEQCDKVDGSCRAGCESGWFGPGCQNASLNYRSESDDLDLTWLTDNNDTTCNPGTAVSVEMEESLYTLSWMRLVVKAHGNNVFQIQYKYLNTPSVWHDVDCDTSTVDEKTVDMKCESNKDNVTHVRSINDIVTHVRILGPATQRLCSLYIIGGVPHISNPSKLTSGVYIQQGESLTLTCSAAAVGLTDEHKSITDLTLSRYKVADRRKIRIFAHYRIEKTYYKKDWLKATNFTYKFTGPPSPMTIQWTILDPVADDTAIYECSVGYTEGGQERTRAGQQFLTVEAPTREIQVDVTPVVPNNEFIHGDNITLICKVKGPSKLRLVWSWRHGNASDFTEFGKLPGVIDSSSPITKDKYGAVTHSSEFPHQLTWTADRDSHTFRCEARLNNLVVLSVIVELRVFENCLAYKKHCLSEELKLGSQTKGEVNCTVTTKRLCRDVSNFSCPTDNTELRELEVQKIIRDFDCSGTGRELLTSLENSTCFRDRFQLRIFVKGLADCNGMFSQKIDESKIGGQLFNGSFCLSSYEWIHCAVERAVAVCQNDFGLYAEHHFRIYHEYYYGSMCSTISKDEPPLERVKRPGSKRNITK